MAASLNIKRGRLAVILVTCVAILGGLATFNAPARAATAHAATSVQDPYDFSVRYSSPRQTWLWVYGTATPGSTVYAYEDGCDTLESNEQAIGSAVTKPNGRFVITIRNTPDYRNYTFDSKFNGQWSECIGPVRA